jgi:hypothetical protein
LPLLPTSHPNFPVKIQWCGRRSWSVDTKLKYVLQLSKPVRLSRRQLYGIDSL